MTYAADGVVAASSWAVLGSVVVKDASELIKNAPSANNANVTRCQKIASLMKNFLSELPLMLSGATILNLYVNTVDSCEILGASALVSAGTLLLNTRKVKVSLLEESIEFFGRFAIAAGASMLFQTIFTVK